MNPSWIATLHYSNSSHLICLWILKISFLLLQYMKISIIIYERRLPYFRKEREQINFSNFDRLINSFFHLINCFKSILAIILQKICNLILYLIISKHHLPYIHFLQISFTCNKNLVSLNLAQKHCFLWEYVSESNLSLNI